METFTEKHLATGHCIVLSDSHQRTLKYLQAIALGKPCVSHIWVKDSCLTVSINTFMEIINIKPLLKRNYKSLVLKRDLFSFMSENLECWKYSLYMPEDFTRQSFCTQKVYRCLVRVKTLKPFVKRRACFTSYIWAKLSCFTKGTWICISYV